MALISAQLKTEPFLLIFLKPRFVFLENVDADIETGSRLSFAILFLGPARRARSPCRGAAFFYYFIFGCLAVRFARYGRSSRFPNPITMRGRGLSYIYNLSAATKTDLI